MKNNKVVALVGVVFSLIFAAQVNASIEAEVSGYESVKHELVLPQGSNIVAPSGLGIGSKGELVTTSRGKHKVLIFNKNGNFLRGFGEDILKAPHGLRVDKDDNIWVTDIEQHLVFKLSFDGKLLMILGQQNTPGLYDKKRQMVLFDKPADIAFGKGGDIYIADGYGNSRVVQLSKHGEYIRSWGESGSKSGEFNNPHNIVVANNETIYVADRHNNRIQVFTSNGQYISSWNGLGTPWGLAADDNNLYVADGNSEKILVLNFDGTIVDSFGGKGNGIGQFRAVHGIAVDKTKGVWVAEILNWRIQAFHQTKQ